MKKREFYIVLCGLIGLSLCGCASIGDYFNNRARDLGECFILEAGIGYGASLHILCTDTISTGIGFSRTNVVGIRHGKVCEGFNVHIGLPVSPFFAVLANEEGFPPLWITDATSVGNQPKGSTTAKQPFYNTQSIIFLNLPAITGEEWRANYPNEDLATFDVEVALTAGFFSLRIGFSIGQFVDFLLGWLTLDIGKDDTKKNRSFGAPRRAIEKLTPHP
ncbi:MAG: hypothetical protein N2234_09090 [Planctomycetota bacterium]|nr:hypothetical protein [Planctomycetota bacterium]